MWGLVDPAGFAVRSADLDPEGAYGSAGVLCGLGGTVVDRTETIAGDWAGLEASYCAPEQDAVWGLMVPVRRAGAGVGEACQVAGAGLKRYAADLEEIKPALAELEAEAQAFVRTVSGGVPRPAWLPVAEDAAAVVPWYESPGHVAHNEQLAARYAALESRVVDAVRRCVNALVDAQRWLPSGATATAAGFGAGGGGLLGGLAARIRAMLSAGGTAPPERGDYLSDAQWADAFTAWAQALPLTGRQRLRLAVAALSDQDMNTLLHTKAHPEWAAALAPLLGRTDLSKDPVYGDLYRAAQAFPDPAHHTYDPNDARDTKAAAAAVAAAWAALNPAQRKAAARMYPWLVGSADGVDAVHRDVANRQVLAIDLAATNAQIERLTGKSAADLEKYPGWRGMSADEIIALAALMDRRGFLENVQDLLAPVEPGDGAVPPGYGVTKYLLVLDPEVDGKSSSDQTGRAAIAWGNPDTATNVAVLVPGMNTFASNPSSLKGVVDSAARVHQQTDIFLGNTGGTVSTVAWVGYDAPGLDAGVVTDKKAHEGAFALAAFEWGLEEAHVAATGTSPTMTTLAHSYGSVVAGAATHHDNPNDNLVIFGSPGTTVDHASELDIPEEHVYKALAEGDFVGEEIAVIGPFGNQPASQYSDRGYGLEWGGIRMQTDGIDNDTEGSSGHSEYTDQGTESLRNMSAVVAGRPDLVTTIDERRTTAGLPGLPGLKIPESDVLAPGSDGEYYDPFAPREF